MSSYDDKVKETEERNKEFLDLFERDLKAAGLKERTVNRHLGNAALYINDYLTWYEIQRMEDGTSGENLDDFFSDFFIRKCMWSAPGTVKSTAASLKKFYKCMFLNGKITSEQYVEADFTIRENTKYWQIRCSVYNEESGDGYW